MNDKDIENEYKFILSKKQKSYFIKKFNKLSSPIYFKQYQRTSMYDNKDKLMQKKDGRIRIRIFGDTNMKSLSYKKPIQSVSGIKREIEYEVKFEDKLDHVEKILEAMDFELVSAYERYRSLWEIDNLKVTIDEYPFTDILEIEGKVKYIKRFVRKFQLKDLESSVLPIDTLFTNWRKKNNLKPVQFMTFKNYDK